MGVQAKETKDRGPSIMISRQDWQHGKKLSKGRNKERKEKKKEYTPPNDPNYRKFIHRPQWIILCKAKVTMMLE